MKKIALITGASDGIGRAIAKKLAEEGYQITAVARNEAKLKSLVQELGKDHTYLIADLSTEEGQNRVAEELTSKHYDLLVNNAGVGTVGTFNGNPLTKQIAMLRLNCEAVVKLAYAFLKNAKANDALMNVSSTLAFLPMPSIGLYSATKSFVTAFSDSLWFEQKPRGVYVVALHPGITSTNFQANAGGNPDDLPKNIAQTPEQVAEVAIRALRLRKKPVVISGIRNTLFAGISRVISRKSTVTMMGKMAAKTRPMEAKT